MLCRNCKILLFLLIFTCQICHAFDLDMTVDDDIRKNYNSTKLIKETNFDNESLPPLPDKLRNTTTVNTPKKVSSEKIYYTPALNKGGNVKIFKGTTFNVVSMSKISDWQSVGTTVKFRTNSMINRRKYTIPAGTVFSGEIIERHQPQITCNGGLVVIRIHYMTYKGQNIPLNAYVTRANGKMIFLNNIKGNRTYLKTVWKKGNWGRALFHRMFALTVNLGGDGSTFILSPFPLLYGTICLGANTLISPVTAFFQRGGHVSINAGSAFRIRLLDDTYID